MNKGKMMENEGKQFFPVPKENKIQLIDSPLFARQQ